MAKLDQRLPDNVEGDLYVDASCIDCETCRWVAPATFDRRRGQSRVYAQPRDEQETQRALMALVACPTSSIGTTAKHDLAEAARAFPDPITADVLHCGYHDEATYGAASWLVLRAGGNILVDVPRFATPLVRRIEELGGVRTLFLTHRDDVGEHERWARHFGARRVMHAADAVRGVEQLIDGTDDVVLQPGVVALPTPGHTRGSACLLVDDAYLFTGDHMAWDDDTATPYCFRDACWYSWDVQRRSVEKLLGYAFQHVLPGHGRRGHADQARMPDALRRCLTSMR